MSGKPNFLLNNFFGEVINAGLDFFEVQCWDWDKSPAFGSLVMVQGPDCLIIGCVSGVQTASSDPMRTPFAYKKTEEELKRDHPHIFEFLKTTVTVQVMGFISLSSPHKQDYSVYYVLPASPPKIHAFVSMCTQDIFVLFFQKPHYLHLLFAFAHKINNLDEILLALLRQLVSHKVLTQEYLDDFCTTFSLLSGNDYRRLKLFLQRAGDFVI
jgi:hypothetical protein